MTRVIAFRGRNYETGSIIAGASKVLGVVKSCPEYSIMK